MKNLRFGPYQGISYGFDRYDNCITLVVVSPFLYRDPDCYCIFTLWSSLRQHSNQHILDTGLDSINMTQFPSKAVSWILLHFCFWLRSRILFVKSHPKSDSLISNSKQHREQSLSLRSHIYSSNCLTNNKNSVTLFKSSFTNLASTFKWQNKGNICHIKQYSNPYCVL